MSSEQLFDTDDLRLISKTQKIRERIVDELTAQPTLPSSKNDQEFLISALDGIDKNIAMKSKLKLENKNSQLQQQHTAIIAEVLLRHKVNQGQPRSEDVVLPNDITIDVLEGETEMGLVLLDQKNYLD